jgi:hypothetical protein
LQGPLPSLNSRKYTNGITLCLFLLHLAAAAFAMGFFVFKTAQEISQHPRSHNARRERSLLRDWLLPVEGAVALSIVLAFAWQKAVRAWPRAMVRVILARYSCASPCWPPSGWASRWWCSPSGQGCTRAG